MKRLSPWLFGSGLSLWLLGCAPAHLAPPGEEATVDSSSGEARANKRRSQKQGLGGARLLGLDGDDQNVAIDPHGFVVLDQTKTDFNFLWVANKDDWDTGSVSKLDQRTHKEVARYFSVTCFGLPDGGRQACSGFSGCCSVDDDARWELRRRNADFSNLPHQEVQRKQNHPSRTALAFDGSVFVANRAFGGQGSLTHIANDPATCDPNHNHAAGLQTSSDLNGDGVIETDCNRNGLPDDLADTSPQNPKGGPCTGGRQQEFFGLDDDCVLWTANFDRSGQIARPIAVGKAIDPVHGYDVWTGSYASGRVFRVDGTNGQVTAETKLPGNPYGFALESSGILWATQVGSGKLMYFDTKGDLNDVRSARQPQGFALGGYGIALDGDSNVWLGGYGSPAAAFRYRPDRSLGVKNPSGLGSGRWLEVRNAGSAAKASGNGRGVAFDARGFVWIARDAGYLVQVPLAGLPQPGLDGSVDGTNFPAVRVAGSTTIGVGVGRALPDPGNPGSTLPPAVYAASFTGSAITRVPVDAQGQIGAPNLAGPDGAGCPSGDKCTLYLAGQYPNDAVMPRPYSYSDFTGGGLTNYYLSSGYYSVTIPGCQGGGATLWESLSWQALLPPQTTIYASAATGTFPANVAFSGPAVTQLTGGGTGAGQLPLNNAANSQNAVLRLLFQLQSSDLQATPALTSFTVTFRCL